jgi:hypothetical protein
MRQLSGSLQVVSELDAARADCSRRPAGWRSRRSPARTIPAVMMHTMTVPARRKRPRCESGRPARSPSHIARSCVARAEAPRLRAALPQLPRRDPRVPALPRASACRVSALLVLAQLLISQNW